MRPARPVGGQRDHDEPGIVSHERVPAQVEPVDRTGSEVLDDDIRLADEAMHEVTTSLGLEVDGEAALVPVDGEEVGADAVCRPRWAPGAQIVARARPLDLDDVGAEVAQDHRSEGARKDPRQVEDPDSVQRPRSVATHMQVSRPGSGRPRRPARSPQPLRPWLVE